MPRATTQNLSRLPAPVAAGICHRCEITTTRKSSSIMPRDIPRYRPGMIRNLFGDRLSRPEIYRRPRGFYEAKFIGIDFYDPEFIGADFHDPEFIGVDFQDEQFIGTG